MMKVLWEHHLVNLRDLSTLDLGNYGGVLGPTPHPQNLVPTLSAILATGILGDNALHITVHFVVMLCSVDSFMCFSINRVRSMRGCCPLVPEVVY